MNTTLMTKPTLDEPGQRSTTLISSADPSSGVANQQGALLIIQRLLADY